MRHRVANDGHGRREGVGVLRLRRPGDHGGDDDEGGEAPDREASNRDTNGVRGRTNIKRLLSNQLMSSRGAVRLGRAASNSVCRKRAASLTGTSGGTTVARLAAARRGDPVIG